jgi:hypothetical protein
LQQPVAGACKSAARESLSRLQHVCFEPSCG